MTKINPVIRNATWQSTTQLVILWGGITTLFLVGAWLAVGDKTASSATCLGFGVILLFIANLDRIASFKGFGLEATTRDLKESIAEAGATLAKLEDMRSEVSVLSQQLSLMQAKIVDAEEVLTKKLAEIAAKANDAVALAIISM